MPREKRIKVPLPTKEEMNQAHISKREIVALSAKRQGQLLFLKFGLRTNDTHTYAIDTTAADYLLRSLRGFLPTSAGIGGSAANWADEAIECQFGTFVSR